MKAGSISSANFRGGFVAALFVVLCCESYAAPLVSPESVAAANNGFAFNLLKQLATEQPGSNIFISPYSASTALQMVCSGAEGKTRTEIQEMLGTIDVPPRDLYEANKEIGKIINCRNTNYALTTANAIWYLRGFPVELSFLKGNEDYFGARVQGLDFSEPSSANIINAWATEATQGNIDEIVKAPLSPAMVMLLANAVYFHGTWEYQFDTNYTTNRTFTLAGGATESVPMMQQSTNFNYFQGDGFQAVELPYQGTNLSMYVFLPDSTSSLEGLLGTMSGQWWQETLKNNLSMKPGTITLPKFSLNNKLDLVEPLEALGMVTAFTDFADFTGISRTGGLSISDVRQQAIVEVSEEGTVATAVTTITVIATVAPVNGPFEMVVDHPFLFFIQDQEAGTILFMGAVFDPS